MDRYELSSTEDYHPGARALLFFFKPLEMMGVPIQLEGHTIPLDERGLLEAGDGLISSTIGTKGMLAVFDFLFWFAWINFILGFANLIPMVPFDGGHMFRDLLHGSISGVKKVGKKLKLWNIHALKVDHFASKASSLSSLFFLLALSLLLLLLLLMLSALL